MSIKVFARKKTKEKQRKKFLMSRRIELQTAAVEYIFFKQKKGKKETNNLRNDSLSGFTS